MNPWITNVKFIVLAAFLIASLTTVGYEWWYVWPARKCENHSAWWDPKDRQCLVPMPIWRITNRRLPTPTAPKP